MIAWQLFSAQQWEKKQRTGKSSQEKAVFWPVFQIGWVPLKAVVKYQISAHLWLQDTFFPVLMHHQKMTAASPHSDVFCTSSKRYQKLQKQNKKKKFCKMIKPSGTTKTSEIVIREKTPILMVVFDSGCWFIVSKDTSNYSSNIRKCQI